MINKPIGIVIGPDLMNMIDGARVKYGMNRSDFIRYAVRTQAAGDLGSDPVKIVPMKKYQVHFRSADGTLNQEYTSVASKDDIYKIYDNIVNIAEVA